MPYARVADRISGSDSALEPGPLDLTAMEGDRISASGLPGGVAAVRTYRRDGSLIVHAFGEEGVRPGDWGEATADGVFANALRSRTARAFTATFAGEQVSTQVQTYHGLGVLTLHAFHHFTDGSGRRDYFTREFFVQASGSGDGGKHGNAGGGEFPRALLSGGNDPEGLLGRWTCLDPAVESIGTLECDLADGTLTVRAEGAGPDGPIDWGVVGTQLYADGTVPESPPAFLATYDHGFMRMRLQARINRGILVVVEYAEFTDGSGRPDYFIRECYQRHGR
jgi:hypothetical protein